MPGRCNLTHFPSNMESKLNGIWNHKVLPQMETSSGDFKAGLQLGPLVRFTGSVHLWHSLSSLAAIADTPCYADLLLVHSILAQGSLNWISHLSCFSDKPSHNLSYYTQVTIVEAFWVCVCASVWKEKGKRQKRKVQKRTALWETKGSSQGYEMGKWKFSQLTSWRRRDKCLLLMDLQVKGQVYLISKMSFGSRHKVLLYLQPYTVFWLKNEAEQLICLNQQL